MSNVWVVAGIVGGSVCVACDIQVGSNPPELQVKGERILTDPNDDNHSGLASGVQEPQQASPRNAARVSA